MNIFMNVGLLPVMGLTLPFFSYGGTSIVTMFAALGIAAGVRMRVKAKLAAKLIWASRPAHTLKWQKGLFAK